MANTRAVDAVSSAEDARLVAGYRLERRLGRGAMGEVWLGRHHVTGGLAAVKLLRAAARNQERLCAFFHREGRAIARLSHPNIVAVYDVAPNYLITAFVPGHNLSNRLRTPLEPAAAMRIGQQIASALAHAHARGVIHRDVKPSNILVDAEDNGYLADFGIARLMGEEGKLADASAGTPGFMAPEQARGEPITPACDQYALGRTLLAMLIAQRVPENAEDALALLPGAIPGALTQVLRRAIAEAPEARFPSVREFELALAEIDLAGHSATDRLLPEQRAAAPFAWCSAPVGRELLSVEVERAHYQLSTLDCEPHWLDTFREATGYAEMGWSVYGRTTYLGPITNPAAFARATDVVVLLHGLFSTRTLWRETAECICRNNGHTLVLVPDWLGCGETRFASARPERSKTRAPVLIAAVLRWLELLGVVDMPAILVGHSFSGAALLSVFDQDLPGNVYRISLAPVFPSVFVWQRWSLRLLALLVTLFGTSRRFYRWMAKKNAWSKANVRYSESERRRMFEAALDCAPGVVARLVDAAAHVSPAQGDRFDRTLVVLTPDDPLLPPRYLKRAVQELQMLGDKVFWLNAGGHNPHLEDDENPQWRARNIDEMVGMVDAVLDQSRVVSQVERSIRPLRCMGGRSGETASEVAARPTVARPWRPAVTPIP